MLIPAGHYREITAPRGRGSREKWLIGAGVAMLAILAVAVVIAFTSVQRRSRHGCIDVSAATFIGGSELYRCGAAARELCQSPPASAHYLAFRRALATSCRTAGLPVPAVPHPS